MVEWQGRKGRQAAAAKIPEKSHFHGKEERNPVTGRTWLDPPKNKKKENEYCYLPKKWVHTWSGHTKGVNAIRFFPTTGEPLILLISRYVYLSAREARLLATLSFTLLG